MQWTEERMQHAAGWAKAVQKGYRANKSIENQLSKVAPVLWELMQAFVTYSPLGMFLIPDMNPEKGIPIPKHALVRSLGCIRGALLKSSPTMLWCMAQVFEEHTNPSGDQRMHSRDAHGVPQSLTSPWACTCGNPDWTPPWGALQTRGSQHGVFCSHCTKVTPTHPGLELLYQSFSRGFSRGQFT